LVGMVTDRDLRTKEHVPQSSHEIPLTMVMHHEVPTLEPHSTLIEAATVLRHKQLDSVPIVTKGRLVGIVTRSDILDAFIAREKHGSGPANA
jgi:CBS domain-containing protein